MLHLLFAFFIVSVVSRDCYLACDEVQITYDKQNCYNNCDLKVIVAATVGSFFGLVFLIVFICCCKYRTYTCMYFLKRKLKQRLNIVDPGSISHDVFDNKFHQFVNALKKSEAVNNFYFQFHNKRQTMTIEEGSVESNQQAQFLKSISFKGKDNFSTFFAEGYFLCRNGSLFVWFFKCYDPYDYAVQLGMKKIIIFESVNLSHQAWTGAWHDEDEGQQNQRIKGKWTLIMKVIGLSNRLEDISPSNQLY